LGIEVGIGNSDISVGVTSTVGDIDVVANESARHDGPGQQLCLFATQSASFVAQLTFGGPFASQSASLLLHVSHPSL
jgi:hypothetical protein